MWERLRQEVDEGCPSISGARVAASVPVGQATINDWLRLLPGAPPGLALDIQPANRIVARYGMVQATAVLDEEAEVGQGAPRIGLELASVMIAWVLRQTVRVPAVRIVGRRITIDLSRLPGLEAAAPYWTYLRRARVRTRSGEVQIHLDLGVT